MSKLSQDGFSIEDNTRLYDRMSESNISVLLLAIC